MTAPERPRSTRPAIESIPRGLRVGAVYSACLLLIAAALAVAGAVVWVLADIVVPVLLGLFFCALLAPPCNFLLRHHWPRWAAVLVAWLFVIIVVALLGVLVVEQVLGQWSELEKQFAVVSKTVEAWAERNPFGLSKGMTTELLDHASSWAKDHAGDIGLQTWLAGTTMLRVLTGGAIAVLVSIFLLWDGGRIWEWAVRIFPRAAQHRLDVAGRAGWHTLVEFPRVQVLIAAFDAVFIGLGAWILGVPLVLPVATLVFFGALIPIVGAISAGALAVAFALLANGWGNAVLMLAVVLVVNQLESHIVQPLLAGNAFAVHPLVVVLGVLGGIAVAGVAGAFFAVPLIATANAMILAAKKPRTAVLPAAEPPAESLPADS